MIEEYNDEYEKGIIFRQKPEPDSPVAPGDEVTVYIGAGTQVEKITVPNLVGKTYEQAEELLSGVGIPIGSSTYAASNDYAEGIIIAQSIEANKEIAAVGSKIGVVISSGPRPTRTPATAPPKATATPLPEPTSTPASTEIPTNEPAQSPTDIPSLPPTTIPTVSPTEPPTAPPTTQRTKVLTVDFGFDGDYAADLPFHVEIYRLDSSGEMLVYDANPIFAEFPIQVPLTDSGMREFVVKIAGVETSSAMIDFDN
jgi:beta-lactam-binding protein with PASTA domain